MKTGVNMKKKYITIGLIILFVALLVAGVIIGKNYGDSKENTIINSEQKTDVNYFTNIKKIQAKIMLYLIRVIRKEKRKYGKKSNNQRRIKKSKRK